MVRTTMPQAIKTSLPLSPGFFIENGVKKAIAIVKRSQGYTLSSEKERMLPSPINKGIASADVVTGKPRYSFLEHIALYESSFAMMYSHH